MTLSGCLFATKAHIDNRKKLLNSHISSTCPHNMANFGPPVAEIGSRVFGTPAISTGFTSCLCCCSDAAHRRPTKLCTMFGPSPRLLHYIYIFGGSYPLIHCSSKSCVLLYWQHYCTALPRRASAKLCSMVQGMELRNFHRRLHLYSAGRPSRWASAHISSWISLLLSLKTEQKA